MAKALRPPPEPAHIDSGKVGMVGTAIWFAALVVMLLGHGWLREHHHTDWLWTAVAGTILGVLGSSLAARHRRAGRTT